MRVDRRARAARRLGVILTCVLVGRWALGRVGGGESDARWVRADAPEVRSSGREVDARAREEDADGWIGVRAGDDASARAEARVEGVRAAARGGGAGTRDARAASTSATAPENAENGEWTEDFELLDPPKSAKNSVETLHVSSSRPEWMKKMWRETVDALSEEQREELDKKMSSVPDELRALGIGAGDELFVTFGTASVKDFVFNWIAAAKKLNLTPIFIGALDEELHALCKRAGVPSMLLTGISVLANRDQNFITGESQAFKKMGTVKTKFIQDLLELGVAPILSDADVVWMKDPRDIFNNGTYKYADILISSDCIDTVADRLDNRNCLHVNFNTGVLHIRPTAQAKEFVEKWKQKVATSTIAWMRDQPALNLLVRDGEPALANAVKVPKEKQGLPGYRSLMFAANNTIRLGVLPVALFSNGHTFFVQEHHLHHPEDGQPYAVHMTYQYGDTHEYAYGKRQRLRQHGLWYADDGTDYWTSRTYLTISTKGAQVKFNSSKPIGTDGTAYLEAISRHFDEDRLRRVTIRNGLALAKALNRTFVFPPARCYCDKIWNTLAGCRALGAETAHLPFSCPMDHIYDLESLLHLGIEFREAGFLEDERVSRSIQEDVIHVKVGVDSGDNSADVVLSRGFTSKEAVEKLKPFSTHAVIMFDNLDDGSFCGFGDDSEDRAFDLAVQRALSHDQYFCFREAHEKQGKPRSGNGKDGEPWEPRVVERHCNVSESTMRANAKIGVVSEIIKDPITCSCEWAYKLPTRLVDTTCDADSLLGADVFSEDE